MAFIMDSWYVNKKHLINISNLSCIIINMKAILMVRVSSDAQEVEEQKLGLIKYSLQFGYKKKDLIIVENEESVLKLKITAREGIIMMKEKFDELKKKTE